MIRKVCLAMIILGFSKTFAQEVDGDGNLKVYSQKYVKTKPVNNRLQGWFISGKNSLQFNQAAFSNWMAGGVNSYALNAYLDYEFNLTKGRHIWDNRIYLAYGVVQNDGEDYRKSNDVIDLTSSYGYEFQKNFYFAASTNIKTQFTEGFDYDSYDELTGEYKKISSFMTPGYWSFGVGVDYKPSENLQLSLHPFTSKFTFVLNESLQKQGNYGLKNDGDSYYYEFGAFLGARYKFNLMKNVSFDNRLGIYSNYLKTPQNMDIAYQGVIDMKINKLISAQATINLFYDEDQIKRTQLKETFGLGISYNFNNTEKLKQKEINLPPMPTAEEAEQALEEARKKADAAAKEVEKAEKELNEIRAQQTSEEIDETHEADEAVQALIEAIENIEDSADEEAVESAEN